jgi:hypothetical protein
MISNTIATENSQEAARLVAAGAMPMPADSDFRGPHALECFRDSLASYRRQFATEARTTTPTAEGTMSTKLDRTLAASAAGPVVRAYSIVMKPHARGKRVWLQGAWMIAAGFAPGTPIAVTIAAGRLTIAADAQGARKVTGNVGRPIIDVIGAKVTDAFPGPSATVTVRPGLIVVEAD